LVIYTRSKIFSILIKSTVYGDMNRIFAMKENLLKSFMKEIVRK